MLNDEQVQRLVRIMSLGDSEREMALASSEFSGFTETRAAGELTIYGYGKCPTCGEWFHMRAKPHFYPYCSAEALASEAEG